MTHNNSRDSILPDAEPDSRGQAQGDFNRQDNLLQSINNVASVLMMAASDEFDLAIWKSLQTVGRTVRVDRAYIWENFEKDGVFYSRQIHEWSEGAEPQQGKEFAEALPYDEIPYWRDCVLAGLPLNGPVRLLPDTERAVLEPQGIKSILVIPVMMEGGAWGYIGFDDCSEERFFSKTEEQMLVSGGTLVVSAIIRNRATNDLKEQIIAAKKATEANESKTNFLARTSHEIRTPMNAIIGMAELALREEISPAVRSHLNDIKHAGASLLAIINDILDFSKIESGKVESVSVDYSLSSLINDVVSIMRTRMAKKRLSFTVDVDASLPDELCGDMVRIRQTLINILDNAVKYTESGFVSLEASGTPDVDAGTIDLKFTVRDSGAGIKSEDYDKLFQDFVRLDRQRNWGVVGTGLGLTISRNFVRAMGGDISVESEYGKGSVFYINIPQGCQSTKAIAEVDQPLEKSVILLEQDERVADSVRRACDTLGVRCDVAVTIGEFSRLMRDFDYSHAIVAQAFRDEAREALASSPSQPALILLCDPDGFIGCGMRALATPVYSVGIANILNDADEELPGTSFDVTFVAPDANVLVVDDNETNLKVAVGLMKPYLMNVDTCSTGAEAIAMLKANRYDIVFMDHMMPEMDGIEATEAIRLMGEEDPYFLDVPIVALTANAVSGMQEMFIERGMNGFLSKPIEVAKLHRELEKRLPPEKITFTANDARDAKNDAAGVDGLDTVLGVHRAGGSLRQYREVLSSYCAESGKLSGALKASLEENDLSRFKVYAHSLKSSSASIGALDVAESAEELEKGAVSMQRETLLEKTENLLANLGALVGNIRVFLLSLDSETDSGDDSLLYECLRDMSTALESFDLMTVDSQMERLSAYSWPGDVRDSLDAIATDLILSDLDAAEERIKQLLAGA